MPVRAAAVNATLNSVVRPVPSLATRRLVNRLEITVHRLVIMAAVPALSTGTAKPLTISGQAAPSRESGRPRLTNALYIIARNSVAIKAPLL